MNKSFDHSHDDPFNRISSYLRIGIFLFIVLSMLAASYLIQTNQTRIKKSRASAPLTAEGKDLDSTCGAARYDYCSQSPKCPDGSWNEAVSRGIWNIDVHNYCGGDGYYCKGYVPFCCYEMVRTKDKDYCQGYDTLSCLPSQCAQVPGAGSKNCSHGLDYYCPKNWNIDPKKTEPVPLSKRFPNDIIFYRLNKAAENEIRLVKEKQPQLWDMYQAYVASGGPWYPPEGEPALGAGGTTSPTSAPISMPTEAPVGQVTAAPTTAPQMTVAPTSYVPTAAIATSAPFPTSPSGQSTRAPSPSVTAAITQAPPSTQATAPTPTPTPIPYSLKALVAINNTSSIVLQKAALYVFKGDAQVQKITLNPLLPTQEVVLQDLRQGSSYSVKTYVGTAEGTVFTQTNKCSRSSLFENCIIEGAADSVSIVVTVGESKESVASPTGILWLDLILNAPKIAVEKVKSYDKQLEDAVKKYVPFL